MHTNNAAVSQLKYNKVRSSDFNVDSRAKETKNLPSPLIHQTHPQNMWTMKLRLFVAHALLWTFLFSRRKVQIDPESKHDQQRLASFCQVQRVRTKSRTFLFRRREVRSRTKTRSVTSCVLLPSVRFKELEPSRASVCRVRFTFGH